MNGLPAQAQEAVIAAASIWDDVLVIDIPFTIRIIRNDRGARISFSYDPIDGFSYLENGHQGGAHFPSALASQIIGNLLNPSQPVFKFYINSQGDWYFGTEPTPESEQQHRLVQAVLHGIGHAVGFISGAELNHSDKTATVRSPEDYMHLIYDKFVRGEVELEGDFGMSSVHWIKTDSTPDGDR